MKTKLTLEKDLNFDFEVLNENELNQINGGDGEEVWVDIDPKTGQLIVFLKPRR